MLNLKNKKFIVIGVVVIVLFIAIFIGKGGGAGITGKWAWTEVKGDPYMRITKDEIRFDDGSLYEYKRKGSTLHLRQISPTEYDAIFEMDYKLSGNKLTIDLSGDMSGYFHGVGEEITLERGK